jgi:hypothetical protein
MDAFGDEVPGKGSTAFYFLKAPFEWIITMLLFDDCMNASSNCRISVNL